MSKKAIVTEAATEPVEPLTGLAKLDAEVARRKASGWGPSGKPDKAAPAMPLKPIVNEIMERWRRKFNITPEKEARLKAEKEREEILDRERAEQLKLDEQPKRWARFCPPKYNGTFDINEVTSDVDRADISTILEWQYGPRGLFIVGESGRSKTWTLYALLERLFLKEKRSMLLLDGIQFGTQASFAFSEPSQTERWLTGLMRPDILVIDDLAKRFTPASQQAFFAILDRRIAAMRPILITSNVDGDVLQELINDKTLSGPIRRRLQENCKLVVF